MKINLAVIGCGYWGRNHVRTLDEMGYLGAICDLTINENLVHNYKHVTRYTNYQDLLMDKSITAVIIATPAKTHCNITTAALNHGKHVLVEKPMAMNTTEADKMITAAKSSNKVLMVGHILEYHPAVVALEQYIRDGHLGKLQYLYSNRLNIGRIRKGESVLWSFAPHDIALIRTIIGTSPTAIKVEEGTYLNKGISDITIMHLDFPNRIKAHIFVSWLHPVKEQKFVVIGDKAMAIFDDQTDEKVKIYEHRIEWKKPSDVANINKAEYKLLPDSFDRINPLRNELQHFVQCCMTGKIPKTGGREGRDVLKILEERK